MKSITKIIAVILCTGIGAFAQAQTTVKTKVAPAENNIHLSVYRQAIALGDVPLAINTVHYLIASDPAKYGAWQDTLNYLYLQNSAYQQSYLLSSALINSRGYTDMRMEIKAISAKALQQPAEAISDYATLYGKTLNPAFGFEQLQLQYSIRRLAETIATGNSLLKAAPAAKNDTVTVMKADNKSVQKITFKAAVCNLMGLAYTDLKDKPNAMAQFEAAIKESPDFELAKNNLEAVKTQK